MGNGLPLVEVTFSGVPAGYLASDVTLSEHPWSRKRFTTDAQCPFAPIEVTRCSARMLDFCSAHIMPLLRALVSKLHQLLHPPPQDE